MNRSHAILLPGAALVSACAAIGTASPTKEKAFAFLTACVEQEAEGCNFEKDGTRRVDVQRRTFALRGVEDEPGLAVANYQFSTKECQYCAFVQFQKDLTFWTAEFYRCANKSKLHLGVG